MAGTYLMTPRYGNEGQHDFDDTDTTWEINHTDRGVDSCRTSATDRGC